MKHFQSFEQLERSVSNWGERRPSRAPIEPMAGIQGKSDSRKTHVVVQGNKRW